MAEHPRFAVTVDLVVLTVRDGAFCVLLIRRGGEPFRGRWALPGGFVEADEDLPDAAGRELAEETGVTVEGAGGGLPYPAASSPRGAAGTFEAAAHLEQLASYGVPGRDPRGRVVTVAYLALLPEVPVPVAGTDAAAAGWLRVSEVRANRLAFDHDRILADGVERARAKLEYTPLAAAFCPPEFTIAALRAVYETVWGVELDPRNFHRKVTSTPGVVVPTGRTTAGEPGRPARLYRRGPATILYPPMLRRG